MDLVQVESNFSKMMTYNLNIVGEKSSPNKVDLERIVPTIDVGQGGYSRVDPFYINTGTVVIAGVPFTYGNIIYPQGRDAIPGYTIFTAPAAGAYKDTHHRVSTAWCEFQMTAAGVAAFAGKYLRMSWMIFYSTGAALTQVVLGSKNYDFVTAPTCDVYPYTFGLNECTQGPLYLPRDCHLLIRLQSSDGTNFPALTMATVFCAAIQRAEGSEMPL